MSNLIDSIRVALPHIAARDESGTVLLSPASTQEVAAILAHCNAQRLPVEIAGAGTKRGWSGTPHPELVLETGRIAGVLEHPWQDLTATVGPGTPWAEMQRVLAAHKQFVALDPLWPERATVGGVLATNDSGALRLRYGSARDLVIGMTIVLADGTIAKTGGKVVKNVAGYDLHKLMIGAFGTLAVITEVTFRLHPLPAERAVRSITSPVVEPLAKVVTAINTSHLNPEAVQIRTTPEGFTADVLLAGTREVLQTKAEALAAITASQGLSTSASGDHRSIFRSREALFDHAPRTVTKLTVLQTAIPAVLAELARIGARAVAYPLGIVYAAFPSGVTIPPALRSLAQQAGGACVTFGEAAEPNSLMREIKRQFDPNRILNRGALGGL